MITGEIPQPKILLEGTHLTKKTDVAFALAEHPEIVGHRRHRWHIPLISSEWETRSDGRPTKADPGRSMIDFGEADRGWMEACYEAYLRVLELHRDYYWIVDRFHVSTVCHQRLRYGRSVDLDWVDRRLAALNVVLVHLTRRPDSFGEARRERLRFSENPRRYDDLEIFVEEQALMREVVARSAMPSLSLDVSAAEVPDIAGRILDWVRSRNLFFKPSEPEGGHPPAHPSATP